MSKYTTRLASAAAAAALLVAAAAGTASAATTTLADRAGTHAPESATPVAPELVPSADFRLRNGTHGFTLVLLSMIGDDQVGTPRRGLRPGVGYHEFALPAHPQTDAPLEQTRLIAEYMLIDLSHGGADAGTAQVRITVARPGGLLTTVRMETNSGIVLDVADAQTTSPQIIAS